MTDATFARRFLIALGLAGGAAVLVFLAVVGIDVLLLVFAGVLVALFLRGLAGFVARSTPLGQGTALLAVFLVGAALAGICGWFVAPVLIEQATHVAEDVPRAVTQLREALSRFALGRMVLDYMPEGSKLVQSLLVGHSGGTIATTLGWMVGGVANLVVVMFIGLYVAVSPAVYRRGLLLLVAAAHRRRAGEVLDQLGHVMQRWLVGKAVGMIVIGTFTSVGLALIGVPAALALGLMAGLLNFIPYLGPVVSFLPAALLALLVSGRMLLWVLALYVVIQALESYVVTPLVQQEAVALPPAVIITAQVLLGVAVGWLGLLLATPLTAAAVVLLDELVLAERHSTKPDRSRAERGAA